MQSRKRTYTSSFGGGQAASSRPFGVTKRRKFAPRKRVYGRSFVARTMGPLANTERKYYTVARAALAISGASGATTSWAGSEVDPATPLCLFCPQLGNDVTNRIGRRVRMLTTRIWGIITFGVSEAGVDPQFYGPIRVVVYRDMQTNAAQSQGEDVLASATATTASTLTAYMNLANLGRFKILKDKLIMRSAAGQTQAAANDFSSNGQGVSFKMTIHHRNPKTATVHFNSTDGGTIADIVDNSLHMIAYTPQCSGAPTIAYTARTVYIDL